MFQCSSFVQQASLAILNAINRLNFMHLYGDDNNYRELFTQTHNAAGGVSRIMTKI